MQWFTENFNIVAAISALFSALAAFAALVFAGIQLYVNGRMEARAAAIQAYQSYVQNSISYPEYADWWRFVELMNSSGNDQVKPKNLFKNYEHSPTNVHKDRYFWFLTDLMNVCNLVSKLNDRAMVNNCRQIVAFHQEFFRENWHKGKGEEWGEFYPKKVHDRIVSVALGKDYKR